MIPRAAGALKASGTSGLRDTGKWSRSTGANGKKHRSSTEPRNKAFLEIKAQSGHRLTDLERHSQGETHARRLPLRLSNSFLMLNESSVPNQVLGRAEQD